MTTEIQETLQRLTDVLESERKALLHGDLNAVATLVSEKEQLVSSLNATPSVERSELAQIHTRIVRNQALLDGALEGIRTVALRMAKIRKLRRSLETYDESGLKRAIRNTPSHRVEKRA